MGMLLDAVKRFFKRKGKEFPVIDTLSSEQAEMDDFFDAIDNYVTNGGVMTFKQNNRRKYCNKLAYRKSKSQARNWKGRY